LSILNYFVNNLNVILKLTLEHIKITVIAVSISTLIGIAIAVILNFVGYDRLVFRDKQSPPA